jgi:hypothetical protein
MRIEVRVKDDDRISGRQINPIKCKQRLHIENNKYYPTPPRENLSKSFSLKEKLDLPARVDNK